MVNPIVQEYFEHGDTKEVQVRSSQTAPPSLPLIQCRRTGTILCAFSLLAVVAEGAEPGPP